MELLFNDDIANILPNELLNISTHNFQKNSLVHNSRILKNFYSIPEQLLEIQNKIAIIIKSHRNINSLFTQDFNFSEDQKDKIQKQFHYYMVMGTHSKIEFNDNFKQFYSENRTVDLDYQYIKSFLSTSRRNPEPFLNFMKNQGYFDNIFDDIHKIKNVESDLFKYHDGCNEGEEFKINRFFTFAKYLKEDLLVFWKPISGVVAVYGILYAFVVLGFNFIIPIFIFIFRFIFIQTITIFMNITTAMTNYFNFI